jgi:hypothetical protein
MTSTPSHADGSAETRAYRVIALAFGPAAVVFGLLAEPATVAQWPHFAPWWSVLAMIGVYLATRAKFAESPLWERLRISWAPASWVQPLVGNSSPTRRHHGSSALQPLERRLLRSRGGCQLQHR